MLYVSYMLFPSERDFLFRQTHLRQQWRLTGCNKVKDVCDYLGLWCESLCLIVCCLSSMAVSGMICR